MGGWGAWWWRVRARLRGWRVVERVVGGGRGAPAAPISRNKRPWWRVVVVVVVAVEVAAAMVAATVAAATSVAAVVVGVKAVALLVDTGVACV